MFTSRIFEGPCTVEFDFFTKEIGIALLPLGTELNHADYINVYGSGQFLLEGSDHSDVKVVQLFTNDHLLDAIKYMTAATATSTPALKFKVGDQVTSVYVAGIGMVRDVDPLKGAGPAYYVEFGTPPNTISYWMRGHELTLAPPPPLPAGSVTAPSNTVVITTGTAARQHLQNSYPITTKSVSDYFLGDVSQYGYVDPDTRKKRKEAGECEECGTLLPMSVWGLGECPNHPKSEPVKQ